jgi:hypothetical protein
MLRFLPSSQARATNGEHGDDTTNGAPREPAERQAVLDFPGPARRDAQADRLFRAHQARSRRPQAQPLSRGPGAVPRTFERRRGRRGGSGPSAWLQRHAMGVVYASAAVAVLSLAFTALQIVHRPDSRPVESLGASTAEDQTLAASAVPGGPAAAGPSAAPSGAGAAPSAREVQRTVKVLEPSYTVQAGDTLNRIAARFDTTVERIQAWNDLPDPRALRVGARLVIPPPLPGEP